MKNTTNIVLDWGGNINDRWAANKITTNFACKLDHFIHKVQIVNNSCVFEHVS